ncbi:MAG: hypothetical protein ACK4FB_08940 [Brevundimonas sp.]|uniref:hypothetical protein n=1 Tax=Brevundimonas sp. TaxID=1871086 RepID=UPI003918F217
MSFRDQGLEGGWSGKFDTAETWAQFDALPVGVKRLYWNAPYAYTARPAFRAWMARADMRAWVAGRLEGFADDVARESARLYGEAQEGWL